MKVKLPTNLVLPANADFVVAFAAEELRHYLERISGNPFAIRNSGNGIRFSVRDDWPEERWQISPERTSLLFAGGSPRAVLYGVHAFLHWAGVRWWTPDEETVPHKPSLAMPPPLSGQPAFFYRDICCPEYPRKDFECWSLRNMLNCSLFQGLSDGPTYVPGAGVHTLPLYVPASLFGDRPDWFALVNGRRMPDWHLCMTNLEMRTFLLGRLLQNIELFPTARFDVSQADVGGRAWCECANCAALVAKEGSQAGPIIDLLNWLAVRVPPDIELETLAYQASEAPPLTLKPVANVVVRYCMTKRNLAHPLTCDCNAVVLTELRAWQKKGRVQLVQHAAPYPTETAPHGLPMPIAPLRDFAVFARGPGCQGVFCEDEKLPLSHFHELRTWVTARLLNNPRLDYADLVREFTDGYYGAAGRHIRMYLSVLESAAKQAFVPWFPHVSNFGWLTPAVRSSCRDAFSKAEQQVASNPLLLARVRNARAPLDA